MSTMKTKITRQLGSRVTISTERLFLRAAVANDAEALHVVFADAEVMRYNDAPHESISRTLDWLMNNMIDNPENGVTEFVICLKQTDGSLPVLPSSLTTIGKIGIWRDGETGFLLHRPYWRKGIMQEAMKALLPYYFAAQQDGGRGFETVTADTDPRNEACIGFLTSFGFEETGRAEGTFEMGGPGSGGEWQDSVYFALGAQAWREAQKNSSL